MLEHYVPPYTGKRDVMEAVRYCFGNFKDGELCLPTPPVDIDGSMKKGRKIAYRPWDVIIFRASLLEHYVPFDPRSI